MELFDPTRLPIKSESFENGLTEEAEMMEIDGNPGSRSVPVPSSPFRLFN